MAGSTTGRKGTSRPARRPAAKAARPRPAQRAPRRARRPAKAPVQIKVGRLGLLILLLIAAALYVSPLRAFFAQQDRYTHEVAQLNKARSDNAALKAELAKVDTKQYILETARENFQLVPAGMQAVRRDRLAARETAGDARRTAARRVALAAAASRRSLANAAALT